MGEFFKASSEVLVGPGYDLSTFGSNATLSDQGTVFFMVSRAIGPSVTARATVASLENSVLAFRPSGCWDVGMLGLLPVC